MKKRVRYILLVIVTLGVLGYVRYDYLDKQKSQKEVIHRFINTFYDNEYDSESRVEEQRNKGLEDISTLLSADYEIQLYDLEWLEISPTDYKEDNIEYAGYTIKNTIKAKNKVTVYVVDVDFIKNKTIKAKKSLYIELLKEESGWKICKLMPCSV